MWQSLSVTCLVWVQVQVDYGLLIEYICTSPDFTWLEFKAMSLIISAFFHWLLFSPYRVSPTWSHLGVNLKLSPKSSILPSATVSSIRSQTCFKRISWMMRRPPPSWNPPSRWTLLRKRRFLWRRKWFSMIQSVLELLIKWRWYKVHIFFL